MEYTCESVLMCTFCITVYRRRYDVSSYSNTVPATTRRMKCFQSVVGEYQDLLLLKEKKVRVLKLINRLFITVRVNLHFYWSEVGFYQFNQRTAS